MKDRCARIPRGDRFDFLFTAEKEGRVLFRVVVQEFVRTAGLRSGSRQKRGNLAAEYFNHIRYKHISMLGNGLYIARMRGIVSDLPAYVLDALGEGRVGHKRLLPHGVEDALLSHKLTAPTQEKEQDVEVFCIERN